ncbi:ATPase AAA, partial [Streptomyces purpurogeneiscleroticus]
TYTGGSWLLDVPDETPTIWGSGSEVLWARGESLMITGPQGVGKTTLASQVLKGCLSLQDEVLGYPIEGFEGRILYLAMDRPQQARRNLARLFAGMDEHREYLDEMLRVVEGPPPADFAQSPETLRQMCDHHGAAVVVIDSMKDAAIGLSKDEVGAGYNRA